ncbi:hypothetical protein HOY80DRAFT_1038577 [Tuber brumale]|nr:hypothetical protein HOY80DRAFT_1038577 [Tuber brumale]
MLSSRSSTVYSESSTVGGGPPSSASSFNSVFEGSTLSPTDSAASSRSNSSLSAYSESFSSFEGTSAATGVRNGLHTSVRILQECRLSLIHIPLHLYPHFVQAVLSLILPSISPSSEDRKPWGGRRTEGTRGYMDGGDDDDDDDDDEGRAYGSGYEYEGLVPGYHSAGRSSSTNKNFVNISVTPVECSVVCSTEQVENLFAPIIQTLSSGHREEVRISEDEFVAIQVDGEGLDAGQRVLDLTSPLALAGVPIFFLTTYFSDYILVPSKNRSNVTQALQRRGFVFEKHTEAFVTSPLHHRNSSSASSFNIPPSPPPTTVGELQIKTFETLRKQSVVPQVNKNTRLVLCAGRRSVNKGRGSDDRGLYLGLVKCLISKPQFLSVTLTDAEPASLLLEKEMLPIFGSDDALLGSKEDVLIPILLDLRGLPVDSTGIVCGVAGKLVGGTTGEILDRTEAIEMSYLSTARAGTVIVAEDDLARAVAALGV